MNPWVGIIVRFILAFGEFPRTIWGGAALGAFVGVIIALIRGDKWIMLYGCAAGLAAGIFLELIIRLIDRINHRPRARR
jgi:hypothetical protein